MSIDKQKLQSLLWSEVAAWKADCAEWKRNTDALQEFLGEKTMEEVALELLAENKALRRAALDAREFILHEAEVRGLLDENNEVSFRHPMRQAAIASIAAAMSKGRSVVCGSEQGSPAPEAPSLQRSACGSEHP
ncbi:hypothetical protein HXW87_21045 [Pseudomonas sp. Y5-11]|jgi:hypothetical protein|uniref:hypothetical protein n=1 Tax=Pseudomonas sp. Y5-11 TaxID=2749808 RepID=UPI001EFBD70A|nr:hypothetical protein [Pseudomonas sp. Y5-11]ULN84567.1 hypothetical protein HXW87_21045 [Pseudomonas sp. Y5-11]